ncbi:MAG: hypothetical protein ACO32I_08805, partial [Candidatus Limnocylindrus sp.]
MAWTFNPFSGTFDQKGSGGGGGGSSYLEGEVQNFSALPTSTPPAVDAAYLVREAEGTWLLNRKPAGIYIRVATTGTRATDWTYAGEFPDVFSDANFLLYDESDSTKNLKFQLSGITTGTTRTLTAPDASGTIALTTDIPAGLADGDKGDITVSSSGATWTIDNNAVSNAKLATVATSTIKGRSTAGTGDVEDLSASQVRTILNVADGAEVNVNADWNATSGDAEILNKPSIPSASSATPQALGTAAAGSSTDYSRADHVHPLAGLPIEYVIACSDETSDLTTGTAKVTFRAPVAFLLTGVAASVNTAPTGSTLIVDINNGANSALSTKLSIDASEKTSATAATAAVIDTSYDDFAADAEITIDIDQIGSTIAGKGLKVIL